jgi:hypothetical protein
VKKIQLGGHRYSNKPIRGYALIDDEDYEIVSKHIWCLDNEGYASTTILENGNVKKIRMHRLILGYPSSRIDHQNHNSIDNRRSNLRLATHQQNARNRGPTKANTSGYKGVHLRRDTNRYQAFIKVEGKRLTLGCFKIAEEAAKAYNKAALKYHGEFAYLNPIGKELK